MKRNVFYSTMILVSIMAISCVSRPTLFDSSDSTFITYDSIGLEFSIEYPPSWVLFESSDTLYIASNRTNLILPQEHSLENRGDFFISLSVYENNLIHTYIDLLHKEIAIPYVDSDTFLPSDTLAFRGFWSEEAPLEVKETYEKIFSDSFSLDIKYAAWKEGIVLEFPYKEEDIERKYVFMRKFDDSIVAVVEFSYVLAFNNVFDLSRCIRMINSIRLDSPIL